MVRELRRRRRRSDEGMTLAELLVAMALLGGLLAIVTSILVVVMTQTRDTSARERQIQAVRVAMMQIDRQVRSGNVIIDPAGETVASSGVDPGYSLRVYTQTDGVFHCVQWRVIFLNASARYGALEFRTWPPGDPALTTAWSTVARNLVRPEDGAELPFEKSSMSSDRASRK